MFTQPDDTLSVQVVIALWQADKLELVHKGCLYEDRHCEWQRRHWKNNGLHSLAVSLVAEKPITFLDADVEAPNAIFS